MNYVDYSLIIGGVVLALVVISLLLHFRKHRIRDDYPRRLRLAEDLREITGDTWTVSTDDRNYTLKQVTPLVTRIVDTEEERAREILLEEAVRKYRELRRRQPPLAPAVFTNPRPPITNGCSHINVSSVEPATKTKKKRRK